MKIIILIFVLIFGVVSFADDIQDGRIFYASKSFTATTQDFLFRTSVRSGIFYKLPRVSVSVTAQTTNPTYATIEWYESTSFGVSSYGTSLTVYNANRDLISVPQSAISHSPIALTTTGITQMPTIIIPKDQIAGFSRTAVNPIDGSGWMLKSGTQYFFRVTPSSATDTFMVRFDWKE